MSDKPTFAELIALFGNPDVSNSSLHMSDKRREVILDALNIANSLESAQWPAANLLTAHPPCEQVAKPFDLHTLNAGELQLLRQLRNGPIEADNHHGNKALYALKDHGLVTIEWARPDLHPSKDHSVIITITAKGKAAR